MNGNSPKNEYPQGVFPLPKPDARQYTAPTNEPRNAFVVMKDKIRTHAIRTCYWLAYWLTPAAIYTRHPFVRYPYMNPPSELLELTKQLLSVQAPGAVVEVGCNQGWTTCFLLETLREKGILRQYVCIDTFSGFTAADAAFEYKVRGKAPGIYDESFLLNDPVWLKASLARFGYENAKVHKADGSNFDYQTLGPIAFAYVDVDLYLPVKASLERILPNMAAGGMIVVDDCDANHGLWDGAFDAYTEFCAQRNIRREIICQKFGIIRT
jgi:O-methyltransferase